MDDSAKLELITLTAEIASAYVRNNTVGAEDLTGLIQSIHHALANVEAPVAALETPKAPAISIRKSIGEDFIICLEDGRRFKSLKRHLSSKYNLSPDAYRAKWGLPKDYPMVAPAYAAARSALAKQIGLGQGGRTGKPAASEQV